MEATTDNRTILFFDGVCGLCNGAVDFTLARDRALRIHYSALQGELAARILPPNRTQNLSTLVLLHQGRIYEKSRAALQVFKILGGAWAWLGALFWIIPSGFSDWIYDGIAARRYDWFGKREVCRLPSFEEQKRFI